MNLGKYSANSFPTMQTGSGKPRLALTFDLTRQVEEDPMCLILRAEGGSFSCVAARPHQRVYRRGQDEALPTSGVCDPSHLESSFTQCGRPCSAFASYFQPTAETDGQGERGGNLGKPAAGGHLRKVTIAFWDRPRLQFVLFHGQSSLRCGGWSSMEMERPCGGIRKAETIGSRKE
jgi:hypothetical protein